MNTTLAYYLQTLSARPECEIYLRAWFEKEWGHTDPFDTFAEDKQVPEPILAFDEKDQLVGGLAFAAAKHPSNDFQVAWINAVYVEPDHRRSGIASSLVREAVVVSSESGFVDLYVYTDVPDLYVRQGWSIVSQSGTHSVLAHQA